MAIQLNHTIVHVRDKAQSAKFYADILGLPAPRPYGPFLAVELVNGVSLDFLESPEPGQPQHYAFLVSDTEWDDIFRRIKDRGITYYADPMAKQPNQHNTHDGGRGLYWHDPDGNWLEIITVPYGGWANTV